MHLKNEWYKARYHRTSVRAYDTTVEPCEEGIRILCSMSMAADSFELQTSGHTILCLDYGQNGLGSDSCGPELLEKYRLDSMEFTFAIQLKCISSI